ncbi:hypothetical protein [Caballeronia sp. KNU42]
MSQFLRESKWKYDTGATGGMGTAFLAASGGTISLKNPDSQTQEFSYAGFGLSVFSVSIPKIKIPNIPIVNRSIGATGAAESFDGSGLVYMTDSFHGNELSKSDLQGGTVYFDAAAGLLAGYGASVMLLGINTAFITPWLLNPGLGANLAANAIQHAPALLVMRGQSEGLIASLFDLSAMIGYLH